MAPFIEEAKLEDKKKNEFLAIISGAEWCILHTPHATDSNITNRKFHIYVYILKEASKTNKSPFLQFTCSFTDGHREIPS